MNFVRLRQPQKFRKYKPRREAGGTQKVNRTKAVNNEISKQIN